MRIAIFSSGNYLQYQEELKSILKRFAYRNLKPLIEASWLETLYDRDVFFKDYSPFYLISKDIERLDIFITIGGDGTILRAITHIKDIPVPIVGINTGRLGFLASIQKEDVDLLIQYILSGKMKVGKRSLLSIETPHIDLSFALNDIAVSRKDTTSMITIETYLDDEFLGSYWADGLLISTPTGSTGYSLSCGGPIVVPSANSFIITPIAPHNLNVRPLVISDDTSIKLKVSGRENTHLISLDSRIVSVENNVKIIIKKAPFQIHMVELEKESFFKTLRKKLFWGEDRRN